MKSSIAREVRATLRSNTLEAEYRVQTA